MTNFSLYMCPKCGYIQKGNYGVSKTKSRYGIKCLNCESIFFNTAKNIVSPIFDNNEPSVYLKLNEGKEMVKRMGNKKRRYVNDYMFKMKKKDWNKYNKINKRTGDIDYEKKIVKPLYYNNEIYNNEIERQFSEPLKRKDFLIETDQKVIKFYEEKGKLPLEGELDKEDDPEIIMRKNKRRRRMNANNQSSSSSKSPGQK